MKTFVVVAGLLFASCQSGFCDSNPFLDQFQVALLGHTETIAETTSKGTSQVELLATPIQIGQMKGEYLLGVDGGVYGNIQPEVGQEGINWTAGLHLHLSPILKKYIFPSISPDYPAITALELNPRLSYDFTARHIVFGFGVGWAFSLTPIQ